MSRTLGASVGTEGERWIWGSLPVADCLWTFGLDPCDDDASVLPMLVERKSAVGFCDSIADGRLDSQLLKMEPAADSSQECRCSAGSC